MAVGTTLELTNVISPDQKAREIVKWWITWDNAKAGIKANWLEVRNYLYATDTTSTTNKKLPWKNKTTTPKLTQISDNLHANYMASIFPKQRFMKWESFSKDAATKAQKDLLESYSFSLTQRPEFKEVLDKLLLDFIHTGNCFVMPDWKNENDETDDKLKVGYEGPIPKRISPYDIVFNPIAASFKDTPKIIRSVETMGDLENILSSWSAKPEQAEVAKETLAYLHNIRNTAAGVSEFKEKDEAYRVDGFGSFHDYLQSSYVELLYFFGDFYDPFTKEFKKNQMIVVADRHRIVYDGDDPSSLGRTPLFHAGWRARTDNLWAMGPLENLVGLQYRIDHIENLKADCFDLIAFPPLKIKGYVESFQWGPMEKIIVDSDGDVEMMSPDAQALNANIEINLLEQKMEEMAGAPKEAMGFRTPGEKTMYEVQRLENAASRIFQSKIALFEEQIVEPLINSLIIEAKERGTTSDIKMIDPEFGAEIWQTITTADLASPGKIRPIAARHFAEKAQLVQNLNNFFGSPIGQDPAIKRHFSGIRLAKMFEDLLEIKDYEVIEQNVAIAEETEAAKLAANAQEDVHAMAQTPSPYELPPVGPVNGQ